MCLQVGQTRNAFRLRIVTAKRQRVRIVETQWNGGGESHWRELGVELGKRGDGIELQDFLGDRSGVFGIDVDVAGRECVQDDRRVAEPLLMRRRGLAGRLRGLPQNFTEDVGLGEALRPDIEGRCRPGRVDERKDHEGQNQSRFCGHAVCVHHLYGDPRA